MKPNQKRSRKPNGFSMTELVVATALFAIVSMFAAVLVSSVQDLLLQTSRQTRVDELHANITMNLSDSQACFNTFSGLNYTGAPVAVNSIVSAFGAARYTVGNMYYQSVSVDGMQATNFVFGAGADVPSPYTGRFDLVITYTYAINASTSRSVTRTVTVKTAPTAWVAGNPLTRNPIQCSGGAGVGFGFDIPTYLHRHVTAIPPDETKIGNLTMNPAANMPANLEVIGITRINSAVFAVSDRRLKTDFSPISVPFEKIDKINGYSFTWKKSGRHDHGFIAQEVEQEFPELVETDPVKNTKKLRYGTLIPILAESSRSLRDDSRNMDRKIELLEQKLEKKLKNQKR